MPILTFKGVRSFSSEDPSFPATNLLTSTTSTGKQWKSQLAGESSINVILELENPSTIIAIDIGNEHSAFVEVLVSKNGSSEFQQILLTSSFMSPLESRNSDPVNRVRCFGRSALVESVVESKCKWDLVKIVCSQPFNQRVQYGLSFVKLHSSEAKETDNATAEVSSISQKLFGNFKIREDSPDSESESPTSLFSRWKQQRSGSDSKEQSPSSKPLSAAAAIRKASTTASLQNHSPQVNRTTITPKRVENRLNISALIDEEDGTNKKNRNRSELMYEDEDDVPNEKLDKIILKERERLEREKNEKKNSEKKKNVHSSDAPALEANKNKLKDSVDGADSSPSSSKMSKTDSSSSKADVASTSRTKRQSSPIRAPPVKKLKETKERTYKPFNKLLEGVVLVISGIQNPARADIRRQALEMGAKYKPDWERSCTHLICAFKNTPKYKQVHGQGKIITKDWITECHAKKMRIPWRRFAMDSDDAAAPESEDEIFDKSLKPPESSSQRSNDSINTDTGSQKRSPKKQSHSSSPSKSSKSPSASAIVLSDDDMASDNESLDRYNLNSSRTERNNFVSSGSDTEDEIRRVLEKKTSSIVSTDSIYSATTEEEIGTPKEKPKSITPLPEFFKGKQFYLSRNISSTDEIKLKRFIEVYGGQTTLNANASDYILSNHPKVTHSDFKGEVVKPLWVFECNDLETLLPTKRYNFSDW